MVGPNKEDRILGLAASAIAAVWAGKVALAIVEVRPVIAVVLVNLAAVTALEQRIVAQRVSSEVAEVAAALSRASIVAGARRAARASAEAPAAAALAVVEAAALGAAAGEVEAAEGAGDSVKNVEGQGTNIELKKVSGFSVQF